MMSPTPNLMFRNIQGTHFAVSDQDNLGVLGRGHGISFLDLDNDGHQDIAASFGGLINADATRDVIFMNTGSKNNWIKVVLRGVRSNRLGLGARLTVVTTEGGKERPKHLTYGMAGSFGSNPVTVQHVGLGRATTVQNITVHWPHKDSKPSVHGPFEVNREVLLVEGEATVAH